MDTLGLLVRDAGEQLDQLVRDDLELGQCWWWIRIAESQHRGAAGGGRRTVDADDVYF